MSYSIDTGLEESQLWGDEWNFGSARTRALKRRRSTSIDLSQLSGIKLYKPCPATALIAPNVTPYESSDESEDGDSEVEYEDDAEELTLGAENPEDYVEHAPKVIFQGTAGKRTRFAARRRFGAATDEEYRLYIRKDKKRSRDESEMGPADKSGFMGEDLDVDSNDDSSESETEEDIDGLLTDESDGEEGLWKEGEYMPPAEKRKKVRGFSFDDTLGGNRAEFKVDPTEPKNKGTSIDLSITKWSESESESESDSGEESDSGDESATESDTESATESDTESDEESDNDSVFESKKARTKKTKKTTKTKSWLGIKATAPNDIDWNKVFETLNGVQKKK